MGVHEPSFESSAGEPNPIEELSAGDQDTAELSPGDDDLIKRTVPAIVASRVTDNQPTADQDPPANEEDGDEEEVPIKKEKKESPGRAIVMI